MNLNYNSLIKKAHYHNIEKDILKRILADLKKQGSESLLDVGCGMGEYVKLFNETGLKFEGVDLSEEMISIANKNGHHAFTLEELKRSNKRYDIVLISHVIEHLHYKELIDFMHFYIDRLNVNGRLILLSPLLVENFYYDFTHERPYYPQAIWQMFGDYNNSLSVKKKVLIRLDDIYFVKDCFRTRTWRSYYLNQNKLSFSLTCIYNYFLASIYLITGARFGKKVSWIGIYKSMV